MSAEFPATPEEERDYMLRVAEALSDAGIAVSEYYTEFHEPTDHFLRIYMERANVDVGWNSTERWFYLAHFGVGSASMTGAVEVDPAGKPEDVVPAVLSVLAEVRQVVTR